MPEYLVNHRYKSSRCGGWEAGRVVDLPVEEAEWVNNDSPGALTLVEPVVEEPEPEPPPVDEPAVADPPAPVKAAKSAKAPAANRMVSGGPNREG